MSFTSSLASSLISSLASSLTSSLTSIGSSLTSIGSSLTSIGSSLTSAGSSAAAAIRNRVVPRLRSGVSELAHRVRRTALPKRFVVSDRSMEPSLVDGQGLIGLPFRRAMAGQLRSFEHPQRPGFWLVKRVVSTDGSTMFVESDNKDLATIDSRTFGSVPVAGSYRILIRIPRTWM